MQKYILTEGQLEEIVYLRMSEQQTLLEGKFAESTKDLAKNFFPSFLDKISDEELTRIENAFLKVQEVSSESRKWIIGMVITGKKDTLLNHLERFTKAIHIFISKRHVVEQNGNNAALIQGKDETNLKVNYDTVEDIVNAYESPDIKLLKQTIDAGASSLTYEDSSVIAIELLHPCTTQKAAHKIISGWCTKESSAESYIGRDKYMLNILDKDKPNLRYQMAIIKKFNTKEYTTLTPAVGYGGYIEIRDKTNNVAPLAPVFSKYNSKLLFALANGIVSYVKSNGALFWFQYKHNVIDTKNFPQFFIELLDKQNTKWLAKEIKTITKVDGELEEIAPLNYAYNVAGGGGYILNINKAMARTRRETTYNPKDAFMKLVSKRNNTDTISYDGVELIDVNNVNTFIEYIDIKKLTKINPAFSRFTNTNISPAIIGQALFGHYKKLYPSTSNIELFNSYFRPYLDFEKLYVSYEHKKLGTSNTEEKLEIDIPMFPWELTGLLLHSEEEVNSSIKKLTITLEKF